MRLIVKKRESERVGRGRGEEGRMKRGREEEGSGERREREERERQVKTEKIERGRYVVEGKGERRGE